MRSRYAEAESSASEAVLSDRFASFAGCAHARVQVRGPHCRCEPRVHILEWLYALCREFRRWSVAHPAEFGLMFGSPLPGLANPVDPVEKRNPDSPTHVAGARFAGVFGALAST